MAWESNNFLLCDANCGSAICGVDLMHVYQIARSKLWTIATDGHKDLHYCSHKCATGSAHPHKILDSVGTSCGLNADWNVCAWHMGPGGIETSGDYFILDREEGDNPYAVVRRFTSADGDQVIQSIAAYEKPQTAIAAAKACVAHAKSNLPTIAGALQAGGVPATVSMLGGNLCAVTFTTSGGCWVKIEQFDSTHPTMHYSWSAELYESEDCEYPLVDEIGPIDNLIAIATAWHLTE